MGNAPKELPITHKFYGEAVIPAKAGIQSKNTKHFTTF
jgi:hypothetical protein